MPLIAEHLIVPIRADYLSLESLAQFLRWYRDRPRARGETARLSGILLTMVDYRREATREIVEIIRVHNRRGVELTMLVFAVAVVLAAEAMVEVVVVGDHVHRTEGRELLGKANEK